MIHWQRWIKVIGVALLVWILSSLDWEQATKAIVKLNPFYILGYVGCFVAMIMMRTLRLRLSLKMLGHDVSFKDSYVALLEPVFLGMVTPGRLGEFTRVGYIHAQGVSMQEAISLVTIERLIDLFILVVFGIGGMIYIFAPSPYCFSSGPVMALGLILSLGAIRGYGSTYQFLQKHLRWILHWEPSFLTRHRKELASSFHVVMTNAATTILVLGLLCIFLNFTQIFFLAKAFGFQADNLVVIFAYAASALVALLPISVGGLGTREATYIMIMGREGILKEQALLFSLMDGVVLGMFGLLLLIIPIWILRAGKR